MDQVSSASLQKGARLGPYTILARIGAGGMGQVYRAHDPKLKRDVAIKVLPSLHSGDPDRLRRFEQEARAAAALNHPNILAVFQMGTYQDAPYLVSELLEGTTLREQLKRGPLPLRKALDCGVQTARGLAAAHERGIVHRDLKPENLFVTKDGRLKILDFGLAKLTEPAGTLDTKAPTLGAFTEPGAILGTVGYMAPEQVSGKTADHRADIFAFGAILYETLTGKRAFQKPTSAETMSAILNEDPPDVTQLVPATPPALQRLVQRCLDKNPEQRFQSASDLAFALEALSDSSSASATAVAAQPVSRPFWPRAAAAVALVALGLAAGGYFYFHRAPLLTEKDSIVVADFTNATADSAFDGTLRQGLSVQLAQSPFLSLVSDDHITETLRLMEKPRDTRLTRDVASEVCQRTNATTLVEGSIAALGSQYVVGLDAVSCQSGETLAREQATADAKEKVLTALGNVASELRSKLGESRTSLQAHDVPLDHVTTSSLDALQAWTLGSQALSKGDFSSAGSLLQRAVSLDPNFAQANSTLGLIYGTAGDFALATKYITKAYDLRDRTSERERFSILFNYHLWVKEDQNVVQIAEQWAKLYPRDTFAYLALVGALESLGRWEEALAPAREALRLEPTAYVYAIVATLDVALGHSDQARATIQQALANGADPSVFRPILYHLAFLQNDSVTMDQQLAGPWTVIGMTAPWTFNASSPTEQARSWTAAYYGHLVRARDLRERAIALARRQGAKGLAADLAVGGAVIEALFGNFPEASKSMTDAGDLSTADIDLQGAAGIVWALVGNRAEAQRSAEDLDKRFPEGTYIQFGALPAIRGLLALHRGEPTQAAKALDAILSYELAPP